MGFAFDAEAGHAPQITKKLKKGMGSKFLKGIKKKKGKGEEKKSESNSPKFGNLGANPQTFSTQT